MNKNGTGVTLNLSSNVIGNINDETKYPNQLLSTDTQVSRFHKAFANGSANTKCLKNQLTKIVQSGGFIGELIHGVGQAFFKAGVEVFKRKVKGAIKNTVKEIAKNTLLIA